MQVRAVAVIRRPRRNEGSITASEMRARVHDSLENPRRHSGSRGLHSGRGDTEPQSYTFHDFTYRNSMQIPTPLAFFSIKSVVAYSLFVASCASQVEKYKFVGLV